MSNNKKELATEARRQAKQAKKEREWQAEDDEWKNTNNWVAEYVLSTGRLPIETV